MELCSFGRKGQEGPQARRGRCLWNAAIYGTAAGIAQGRPLHAAVSQWMKQFSVNTQEYKLEHWLENKF